MTLNLEKPSHPSQEVAERWNGAVRSPWREGMEEKQMLNEGRREKSGWRSFKGRRLGRGEGKSGFLDCEKNVTRGRRAKSR